MPQKCNAIGPRGGKCSRNAERDPFTVTGYTLDFCARHNQMVLAGKPLYCGKCGGMVSADDLPND